MAREVATFQPGSSETDDVVRRFLSRQGIREEDVCGYVITRRMNEFPTIELTMYFDDRPGEAGPYRARDL